MKKKFNPHQWLNSGNPERQTQSTGNSSSARSGEAGKPRSSAGAGDRCREKVEQLVSLIESRQVDITAGYRNWLQLAFAFANEFGEAGRDYFHRVSRFHPEYKASKTNRQFDYCLRSRGRGITIGTFFHLARQGNLNTMTQRHEEEYQKSNTKAQGHEYQKSNTKARRHEETGDGPQTTDPDAHQEPQTDPDAHREPQTTDGGTRLFSSFPQGGVPLDTGGRWFQCPTDPDAHESTAPANHDNPDPDGHRGSRNNNHNHDNISPVPPFPPSLFPQLPNFLQRVLLVSASDEERDMMLLGSLVTISSCLPGVCGVYDGKKVRPNLYLFVSAQASAGKGRLVHCKQLVKPVHTMLRNQTRLLKQQYNIEMNEFFSSKKNDSNFEKPEKPKEKMLFIPANNSTTGVFQLLSDNDGQGLIFETEGDTLAQAFKSDYGNYSDGFRKAFHHETISYYRRTDREYVDIESPCLSTVLSGTPRQISSLIPSAENGLFSRFIFYYMNLQPEWRNVFISRAENGLDEYFNSLGYEFFELYKALQMHSETEFTLTAGQQTQFNQFFSHVQTRYMTTQGLDYVATIRRLGLIAFRLAMVLTALRIPETGEFPRQLTCSDQDFSTVVSMIQVLVQHSSKVFSELPEEVKVPPRANQKDKFLSQLPPAFNRQQYMEVARNVGIPIKTAEMYITEFVKKGIITRTAKDSYVNRSNEKENLSAENDFPGNTES